MNQIIVSFLVVPHTTQDGGAEHKQAETTFKSTTSQMNYKIKIYTT